jgi:hypothetical protein
VALADGCIPVIRRVVIFLLAAVMVGSCGLSRPLLTAPPREASAECPLAGHEGVLVEHPDWGLTVQDDAGGVVPVLWPYGSAMRLDGSRIALVGPSGDVIAHVGDRLQMVGGYTGRGEWLPCPGKIAVIGR